MTQDACAAMTRNLREVVAESVAYAVGWLADPAAFRVGMAAIHDGAASLTDAIETALIRNREQPTCAA